MDTDHDLGTRFEVCECGRHGYIALEPEGVSDDLFCRRDARSAAHDLFRNGIIDEDEFEHVLFGIRTSVLPEDIDPHMREMLETDVKIGDVLDKVPPAPIDPWRTPQGTSEEEYVDGIHEFLDTFFPQGGGAAN